MFAEVLGYTLWANRVADYLKVLGAVVGGVFVIRLLKFVVVRRVAAWAKRTDVPIDDVFVRNISNPLLPLLYLAAVYFALGCLTIPPDARRVIDVAAKIILVFLGVRFVIAVIINTIKYYWLTKEADEARERTVRALMPLIKIAVWIVGVIFLLDNLGFKVTTVVAGLGIGGVAVALAGQAILKDLFSYFAILFDRPFGVGDFIAVGEQMGTVEHIGVKTTRLRSLSGEELVFSNADLTDSRVQNYKRMDRRRVAFHIGVTYETPAEKLREIPAIVEKVVEAVDDADFDRAHFYSFGDFNLIFEVVYYVQGSNYKKYMDIQEEINVGIYEQFAQREIDFAYPTQTIYLPRP
ncbi:MAG: mechanosensitive ion channel [candidate division Zixibacteria bacterium]|nr:mechanosensitive ion channel [candidate division Zixibacteria bacterium]